MNALDEIMQSPYSALASPEGAALLAELAAFDEEHVAAAAQRARSLASPEVARAALATTFARRRALASGKFPQAGSMFFTRAGYEQSTSSAVASHRAARFAGLGPVHDWCCGIGSDAIAIAARAGRVAGVDVDADAVACARANADALGLAAKTRFEKGDALAVPLAGVDAVFADPSRRSGASRARDPAGYAPPLDAVLARAREIPDGRLCVKTAPGIDLDDRSIRVALGGLALELEAVSESGTCKEAVMWCGGFARADGARRATAIGSHGAQTFDGDPSAVADVAPLLDCIGEVDASVIRAGLVGALCADRRWSVLDRRVAYVTAGEPTLDPFARWYRVRDAMPFSVKRVREYLRTHDIGGLTIKTRAFPLKPDELRPLLKPRGVDSATLICTTIGQKKTAIACDPL